MEKDKDIEFHVNVFHTNEEPKTFYVNDLWFSENTINIAKKENGNIVWVEKR